MTDKTDLLIAQRFKGGEINELWLPTILPQMDGQRLGDSSEGVYPFGWHVAGFLSSGDRVVFKLGSPDESIKKRKMDND